MKLEPDSRKPVYFYGDTPIEAQFLPDLTWHQTTPGVDPDSQPASSIYVCGPEVNLIDYPNPAGTVILALGRTAVRTRQIAGSVINTQDVEPIDVQ